MKVHDIGDVEVVFVLYFDVIKRSMVRVFIFCMQNNTTLENFKLFIKFYFQNHEAEQLRARAAQLESEQVLLNKPSLNMPYLF